MVGIKIHERTTPVAEARCEASLWLIDWEVRHGLTSGEVVGFLASEIAKQAMYAVRVERHGDAGEKGDEA